MSAGANHTRDSQKGKLYKAERELPMWKAYPTGNIHETRNFVEGILNTGWFKNEFPKLTEIRVTAARNGSRRCTGCTKEITLVGIGMRKIVVLHELSHAVQPDGTAWHGPEFCGIYLTMLALGVDFKLARQLKAAYDKHKVKYDGGLWEQLI